MGLALREDGLTTDSLAAVQRAVAVSPTNLEALNTLGNIYQDLGRLEEAEASFRKSLQIKPNFVEAHSNLGNILKAMGRFEDAEACYRRALEIKPNFADGHYNLGTTLKVMGRMAEAERCFRRAIELNPKDIEAHNNLGNVLDAMGRFDEAAASFTSALQVNPNFADAHYNLGNILRNMGRLREADASYQRALQITPGFVAARSNMLLTHCYMADRSAASLLDESQRFGDLVVRYARPFSNWNNLPDPAKCLRVGIVSGDLRNHPVGYFIESVLSALASNFAGRVQLIVYPSYLQPDEVTARIKACCDEWHPAIGLSDESLARRIREDGIDVLIDLSGHTAHNRLPMFAWKPAPVQVSWLGYFATTGVAAVDYFVADPWTVPESEEAFFTEKIWRLPETRLCFTEPDEKIDVSPPPSLSNGYVTFGCFNNMTKVGDAVVEVWSRVLKAVPGSRLFLKTKQLGDVLTRQRICELFSDRGIERDRLVLEGNSPRTEYFSAYHRIDIALDPFPFPGGTTSVEGLWMGVPVLTLAGQSLLSRQGVSILMNVGLPAWIANDTDDYVSKAVAHANDLPRLADLRAGLREQILASPLFDARRFSVHFESALRGMWTKWCSSRCL